jgi:hypothetical protein
MAIRASNVTAQILWSSTEVLRSISDTITFVEEPFARKILVTNFTVQVLQLEAGVFGNASNSLALVDEVFEFLAIDDFKPMSHTLVFTDSVVSPNWPIVFDTIAFTDEARSSLHNRSVSQMMGLHDGAGYCFSAPWQPIEVDDVIEFEDRVSQLEPQNVTDPITFVDTVDHSEIDGDQFIDFTDEVSVGFGYDLSSTITFTDAIDTSSDFLRVVEDANFIEHAMTYYIDNGCNRKLYARFIGEGSADGIIEQRLTWDSNMVLESLGGDLLALRNPETDDNDRIGFNRINRETRGGELNVYGDPGWAKVNTLLFTIVALSDGKNCPDVINATLDFFQTYIGQEIILHDWTGTSWRGVVTTPDERAVEDSDGWWTLSFEFEGEAEPGSVPASSMSLDDDLSFNADWTRALTDDLGLTDTVHVGGDIYLELTDDLDLEDGLIGTQEITMMQDLLSSGAAVDLHGTTPNTGSSTWSAQEEYQDDGTMANPSNAGAYYPFAPVSGTVYELTCDSAHVVTYEDGYTCIWGLFEDVTTDTLLQGSTTNGNLNPTCAKAVHLMREVNGSIRNNAYRRGSDSDGAADTIQWTDATLRASADTTLDLRIILDTTGGPGNWEVTWQAKATASGSYTEVGPSTALLSENIGAIGFSNDSILTELTTETITLLELRPI